MLAESPTLATGTRDSISPPVAACQHAPPPGNGSADVSPGDPPSWCREDIPLHDTRARGLIRATQTLGETSAAWAMRPIPCWVEYCELCVASRPRERRTWKTSTRADLR